MAQLYFKYGAMGSSKTANALMARFNYEERGQKALMVKPQVDIRDGDHMVHSRIGLTYPCLYFHEMRALPEAELKQYACVIVDEAQFLTREEVRYLTGLQGGPVPRQRSVAHHGRQDRGGQDRVLVRQEGHLQRPVRRKRQGA